MKIAVVHGEVASGAGRDEQDVLTQVDCVSRGLSALGHEPSAVPVSLNLESAMRTLVDLRPAMAFNLVETIAGKGCLIHIVPALLDALKIPYTGAATEAMMLTSNKILAKRWLTAAGLPTPTWLTVNKGDPRHGDKAISRMIPGQPAKGPYRPDLAGGGKARRAVRTPGPDPPEAIAAWVVKSVWEHASVGLDEDSVLFGANRERLMAEMNVRRESLGGECFAEAYIVGREFNLSLLASEDSKGRPVSVGRGKPWPEVLSPAEIRFDSYPPGKVRVVGYRSKWDEDSFEFTHTPRSFDFQDRDDALLADLKDLALRCWELFDLRGYARVDFRVDGAGRPWILEVNANPCLSPDAGFAAAAARAGLPFTEVLNRIIGDR